VIARLILLGVFWIGARYTAYAHPENKATTIVFALLAIVVIVSMFAPSRWNKRPCH
jgi:hypothetical protein